jgi:transcriptional regulator with XRE-family HTH domain
MTTQSAPEHQDQEMNNGPLELICEAGTEATSEATSSPPGAMWSQLVPADQNAATDFVGPAGGLNDDQPDDSTDEGPIAQRGLSNMRLRRLLAKRLIAARELNGFGQTQAALLIGWKNATQLSLLERGTRMPPHAVLCQIARTYGVSVDYILGLSDEPERDPSTAAVKASVNQVRDMLDRNATAVCEALHSASKFDSTQALRSTGVVARVKYLCDAVTHFRAISPAAFDDTRGSARLLYAVREADEAITAVNGLLDQAHRRSEFAVRHGRAAMAGTGGAS